MATNPLHAGHARVVNYKDIRRVTDGHYKIPWVIMSKVSLVLSLASLSLSLSLIYVLKGLRHADKEVAWICNMLDRAPQ